MRDEGIWGAEILANLALSLQQTSGDKLGRTARVGLLDLDIFGPSVPKLMGLEGHEPEMTKGKCTSRLIST